MKGNRQGSLSCLIKRLFETLSEFQKVQQPVGKDFPTGCAGPLEHSRGPAFVQPQQPFSSRQVSGMGAGLLGGKNSLTGNFTWRKISQGSSSQPPQGHSFSGIQ